MYTFRHVEPVTPNDTMTAEEAEEVVRRFQEAAHSGKPRVADVAEALGTSPEDVARILQDVRGQTSVVEAPKVSPRRKLRLIAAGVAAILLGTGVWTLTHFSAPQETTAIATESPVQPAKAAESTTPAFAEAPATDVPKTSG